MMPLQNGSGSRASSLSSSSSSSSSSAPLWHAHHVCDASLARVATLAAGQGVSHFLYRSTVLFSESLGPPSAFAASTPLPPQSFVSEKNVTCDRMVSVSRSMCPTHTKRANPNSGTTIWYKRQKLLQSRSTPSTVLLDLSVRRGCSERRPHSSSTTFCSWRAHASASRMRPAFCLNKPLPLTISASKSRKSHKKTA